MDFNLDEAIRQWAIFMDQLGVGLIYYSVESVHAQKWYSEFEMDYIRATDYDLYANSEHRIDYIAILGPFRGRKFFRNCRVESAGLFRGPFKMILSGFG